MGLCKVTVGKVKIPPSFFLKHVYEGIVDDLECFA
jgi:hypothetical protein